MVVFELAEGGSGPMGGLSDPEHHFGYDIEVILAFSGGICLFVEH